MADIAKKKLQLNGAVINPRVSLDNIVPNSSDTVFNNSASTILNGSGQISSAYIELADNVVVTTGGVIDTSVLPSTVVQTVDGKIPKTVLPGSVDDIIQLIAFSANPPASGMVNGDQYYNSSDKKIYTYNGSWGVAEDPVTTVIYYVPSTKKTYRWSTGATAADNDMVEIAAAIAVTKQGSKSGSQLVDSDDFVPSDKAVAAAIAAAIQAAEDPIADGSNPGLVYVAGASSSANGVTLTLNTSTGALTVTGEKPVKGYSSYTPGVVYIEGSTNATSTNIVEQAADNGVQLKLDQSTGKLSANGVLKTNGGLTVDGSGALYVNTGTGIKINTTSNTVELDTLTGDQVAAGLTAGTGIASVTGGTITLDTLTGEQVAAGLTAGTGIESVTGGTITMATLTGEQVAAGLTAGTGIASVSGGTITASLVAVDL